MKGTLYVVATPLGNLEDLTPRARRVLAEVDLIACEDTRHTRKLLKHFSIQTPCTSYHEYNEDRKTRTLLASLREGKQIALVSDAGTPLISDPGYRLVSACRKEGIQVLPVPGGSAAIGALSVSGLPTDRFCFVGFLPRRARQQCKELQALAQLDITLIVYLSPHGLLTTLQRIIETLGNRKAFLIREMTKLHESSHFGPLEQILAAIQEEPVRGEYTLIVEGAPRREAPSPAIDVAAYLVGLVTHRALRQKEAIRVISRELGLSRQEIKRILN